MWIKLKGRQHVDITSPSWARILEIACKLGWVDECETKGPEVTSLQWDVYDYPDHNARALAKVLYSVIHDIEADCLSEALVQLVNEAGVGNMRRVADLAYAGFFYVDPG